MRYNKLSTVFLAVAMLALTACANNFEVESVEDGIAQGYATVTTLALETVDAHAEGFITDEQAQQAKDLLADGLYNLDNATTLLEAYDTVSAESRLVQAQGILQAVVELLERHQELNDDS